ncbi:hypothetical protein PQO03_00115 [Lentisphaera profundi]|uniref:Uncharacterized protein n=1 Tax=Lentisphaera profundi TaxID=1658616 RepID=A0ABY7VU02_9BACT|nr:hypothetical protein [Lentisphaera profundi]WDE96372.1 hypothetical protein PQO03_00115 [Lentisphaera profundi]
MHLIDPKTKEKWSFEYRLIKSLSARVTKRQLANFSLKREDVKRHFQLPDHLDLWQDEKGDCHLSLCMIWMDTMAPDWMPLDILPASFNCALRLTCLDRETQESCVWVDTRYSDNFLVSASKFFGLQGFSTELKYGDSFVQSPEWDFQIMDGEPPILMNETKFNDLIAGGIKSYTTEKKASSKKRVDLIKEHPSEFKIYQNR